MMLIKYNINIFIYMVTKKYEKISPMDANSQKSILYAFSG